MSEPHVAVLGGGSWGTTVAALVSRNTGVTLWARNPDTVREINEKHTNETYLPAANLPEKLVASSDLAAVVAKAEVLVMAIPSQHFRSVLTEVAEHLRPGVPVISLTKGLEMPTNLRMTEVINEVLPEHAAANAASPSASTGGRFDDISRALSSGIP